MDAKNGTVRKDIVALRELDVVALVKGFYYFILGSFFLCLVGLITWLSPWCRDGGTECIRTGCLDARFTPPNR